jgi:hypothetical protein
VPKLEFGKIKKNKNTYIININNNENEKIKNNENQTLSSIENISNKEINENEKDKILNSKEENKKENKKENEKEKESEKENKENKENPSTRIRVHKYNKDKSNIKIKIKNPVNPNIEYQQIEIKPGGKGYNYRVIKKCNSNKFRKNKNYIKAKNKNEGNENAIKIKASLKPVKNINNKKIIQSQDQDKDINIVFEDNKLMNHNSRTCDNQINIILSNKETNHMVGYERHFGKEENCPLCKNLKKKLLHMEERVYGLNKNLNTKSLVVNQTLNQNEINNNQISMFNKREEEKNLNNNILKDLNMYYIGQSKNRMKQNMFRDLQRKYSAKKSASFKNMFKSTSEQNNGYNINNYGSFSDVEFPAINSYFHS